MKYVLDSSVAFKRTPPQGGTLWLDVMKTCPILHSSIPLVGRAYQIASHARIGVYDCLFVALAEREHCAVITADDKLVKNLQPVFPAIIALASL